MWNCVRYNTLFWKYALHDVIKGIDTSLRVSNNNLSHLVFRLLSTNPEGKICSNVWDFCTISIILYIFLIECIVLLFLFLCMYFWYVEYEDDDDDDDDYSYYW